MENSLIVCRTCEVPRAPDRFVVHKYLRKDGTTTLVRRPDCKTCDNARRNDRRKRAANKDPEVEKRYKENTSKRSHRSYLNRTIYRKYGMTLIDYKNLLTHQDFSCAICRISKEAYGKTFSVDHCHTTGKVRGLLCNSCNVGLGYFMDNKEYLRSAAEYLTTS